MTALRYFVPRPISTKLERRGALYSRVDTRPVNFDNTPRVCGVGVGVGAVEALCAPEPADSLSKNDFASSAPCAKHCCPAANNSNETIKTAMNKDAICIGLIMSVLP